MAVPTYDVRVDWDRDGYGGAGIDVITADVLVIRIAEGADAFGAGEPTQTCTIVVDNNDQKYSDLNSSSPLFGKLRSRRPVHINATFSGTTKGLFDGFVDTIATIDDDPSDRTAEITCIGHLIAAQTIEALIGQADRSYSAMRTAGLAFLPSNVGSVLTTDTPELSIVMNSAHSGSLAQLLSLLNEATGTRHAIRPLNVFTGTTCQYYTRDRNYQVAGGTTATYVRGTDFEKVLEWSGPQGALINRQRVTGVDITHDVEATLIWESKNVYNLAAGETEEIWADWSAPSDSVSTATVGTGTYGVAVTYFEQGAKIVITATTASVITYISQTGFSSVTRDLPQTANSTSSQAIFDIVKGQEISTDWIRARSIARGLADHFVYRFQTPSRRAQILMQDRFAQGVASRLDLHDVIGITDPVLGMSAWRGSLVFRSTTIDVLGERWTETLTFQEMPAAYNPFIIGTSAIGGTDILAR